MKHSDNQHVSQRSGCSAYKNGTLAGVDPQTCASPQRGLKKGLG